VGSISVDTAYEGSAMALYDRDTSNKKYWILGSDYEYGRRVAESFKQKIMAIKPDSVVLGETWVSTAETEFTSPIGAIVRAKPDLLVTTLLVASFQAFAKQAMPYGLFKRPVIGVPIICHEELLKAAGKDFPDGVICSTKYHPASVNTPASRAYLKLYQKTTGETLVPDWAVDGYIEMWLFANAIKKAGTTETEAVIEALKGLVMETPKGTMIIRDCDLKSNLGEWWGISKYDPKKGYCALENVQYIPPLGLMHSCEDVMKVRGK
jgi:ABC-type branched-subunit amino acid transport system substrate-binding protein